MEDKQFWEYLLGHARFKVGASKINALKILHSKYMFILRMFMMCNIRSPLMVNIIFTSEICIYFNIEGGRGDETLKTCSTPGFLFPT